MFIPRSAFIVCNIERDRAAAEGRSVCFAYLNFTRLIPWRLPEKAVGGHFGIFGEDAEWTGVMSDQHFIDKNEIDTMDNVEKTPR